MEPAHIATDHLQMRKSIIHERLHQLSDPAARKLLGERLSEGITEDLAFKELGNEWNPDLPRSYPRERELAQQVRELCGDRAVDTACFSGDACELKSCVQQRLGSENLHKLADLAECST